MNRHSYRLLFACALLVGVVFRAESAAPAEISTTRNFEATGYCWCGECNGYTRGRWLFLKLNFWNRYLNYGPDKGKPYVPRTASGEKLEMYHPGLFSKDSLTHPWMIPARLVFFPWLFMPQDGTIAADTRYYAFDTRMYVPGYGWGVVQDRGGAIKGSSRIDLYFPTHGRANQWGRRRVQVQVYAPTEE